MTEPKTLVTMAVHWLGAPMRSKNRRNVDKDDLNEL